MVLPPRNGLSLCSGGAGLDMGLMLAEPEYHTRCFVEWEEYPRDTIIAGMRAGYLADAPIWDDVKTFDAKPFAGAFDTLIAGYPCQPFSLAGSRDGEDDPRHLWPDIERIIGELGPTLRWLFFENVAGHFSLGLETVLDAIRGLGFTAAVGVFTAEEVGASQERQRIFISAHRNIQEPIANSRKPNAEANRRDNACRCSRATELANSSGGRCGGQSQGQDQQPRGAEAERASSLDHTLRDGRDAGRNGDHPEHVGQQLDPEGCQLADASQPGPQGRERSCTFAERNGAHAPGPTSELCGTHLFPPGPGAATSWADIIATRPNLAPALAFNDIMAFARDSEAIVEGQIQTASEPAIRRMVDGLATRSRALRLLGNGVVPLVAAYAWRTLSAAHGLGWVDMGSTERNDQFDAADGSIR